MFERLKNSNLAYVITLSACLNGVVGCGYFNGIWDTKYYKYQPTFEDRAIARTMIMDKDVLVEKSFNEIVPIIEGKSLNDEKKKTSIKDAMRAMVNEKNKEDNKDAIVRKYVGDISSHIKVDMPINKAKNEAQVKNDLTTLVDNAIECEKAGKSNDGYVDDSFTSIANFLDPESLSDNAKKDEIKKALKDMSNGKEKEKNKDALVKKCMDDIGKYVKCSKEKNEEQVKSVFVNLVTAAVEHEKKEYTVNGLKFKVKDNCIYFTELDISVPLTDIKVSDADVIGFSSDIQKALRWRMDTSRRVRLGSGSAQILAAAAGASLGLATGSVATAAALAAFSAVIPEMQNIFQARDRSVAYEQGLEMIQDSESRYYQSRTASASIGTVSTTELTTAGGKLLVEISACLKVVDKALLQTIPTIEDLQAAKGRLDEALGKIKVVPDELSLEIHGTQTVQILNSKAFTYSVDKAGVVKVKDFDYTKGTDRFEIEGESESVATITVFNASGLSGKVKVTVGRADKLDVVKASATNVKKTTATLNGTVITNCTPTNVLFRYGTTTVYGLSKPINPKTETGTFPVNVDVTDLSPGIQYYFQIEARNSARKDPTYAVGDFFTSNVTTDAPGVGDIKDTTAILKGKITTEDSSLIAWFGYGDIPVVFKEDGSDLGTAPWEKYNSKVDLTKVVLTEKEPKKLVSFNISELTPSKKYYYRLFLQTNNGTYIMAGEEKDFTTLKE